METRLKYIKEVLEENLDMNWTDKMIYDHHSQKYRKVSVALDFDDNRSTYVRMTDVKGKGHLAKVKLNDTKFSIEIEGMKLDVSDHWQELLSQELAETTTREG